MATKPGWWSYALQAFCYVPFIAVVGYFSTSPPYTHLPAGDALVKLSVVHTGERKEDCHERTPEELAKLAPNMRAATVCPRERVPVAIRIDLDGAPLFDIVAPPRGLAHDGASTVYRRIAIPAGRHRIVARLNDTRKEGFAHVREAELDVAAGRVLVIDFDPAQGWVFRG
jgi:hypothetical protein